MGDKNVQPVFDFSKLNFDFGGATFQPTDPSAAAALGKLIGKSSGYLETLPKAVQQRIKALQHLDTKYQDYEEQFEKELKALELKYQNEFYKPLFVRRSEIVSGKAEPTEEELKEEEASEGQEKDKEVVVKKEAKEDDENVTGVPEFWLTVLKHHELFETAITPKDEDALKYLIDITQELHPDDDSGSFTLHFTFKENPYFTNELLSKTYHLEGDSPEEVICESVDSTKITWNKGKDLTRDVKKELGPKGSFFNFFSPPEVNKNKPSKKTISMMELDFEMSVALKQEIINHAIDWFTGDANIEDMFAGGEDDDDDDEDGLNGEGEDDDEEEYNSEDDEDFQPDQAQGKGKEGNPECKQQ